MSGIIRQTIWATAMLCVLLCGPMASAEDSAVVRVKYAEGTVEIDTLASKVKIYANQNYAISKYPDEMEGLQFSRHAHGRSGEVTIDAPPGATIYLIFGAGPKAEGARNQAIALGWSQLGEVKAVDGKKSADAMSYKLVVQTPLHATLSGGGPGGIIVVSKHLGPMPDDSVHANAPPVPSIAPPTAQPPPQPQDSKPPVDNHADPVINGSSHVAFNQASIKSLEILKTETGLMLGQTSELVLTVTQGKQAKPIDMKFVGKTGEQMNGAREDAIRYIRVDYPKWFVEEAELSFEDRDVEHDGGSIGTALGTLLRSVLQGFQIDPNIAITGDISANGKVRAIGGVSAKIRGAIASSCTLVAIPMDNQGQLVDAVTYSGPASLSDIQVIGISNMDDAVATVRTDRDAKLAQAISLFSEIQLNIKNVPGYLKKPEAKEKLAQILLLAPRHLSAKVLLDVISGRQPKTLSATASFYYTSLAVRNVLTVLSQRDKWKDPQLVPSGVVRIGLADLRKLMPIADANVKPLITAWMRFIEAWNELQQGEGSGRELETRAQVLTDEMTKEDTNADLMQKTLKEGF